MAKLILISIIAILSVGLAWIGIAWAKEKPESWSVYYGYDLPAEDFSEYELVIFDSRKHPPLRPLRHRGKTLLGYLSIGEAENYRDDFEVIKEMGVLLEENKAWPGHYIVDIRNPKWAKYLLEEKIPEILHKRFDGLMLDTLDSALYLEQKDPVKYKGMIEGANRLIKAMRMHYPDIKIMLNRGFEALPLVANDIDMLMAESIMVDFHTDSEKPKFFSDDVYNYYLSEIAKAKKIAPNLKIYSLDYWTPEDTENVKKIYNKQRAQGFVPYVSTIDLQSTFVEPR